MKIDWKKIREDFYWQRIVYWIGTSLMIGFCLTLAIYGFTGKFWNYKSFLLILFALLIFLFFRKLDKDHQKEMKETYGPGKWPGT